MPGQKRAREDSAREGSATSQASSGKEKSRSKKSKHSERASSDAPPLTARLVSLAMLPTPKATSPTLRVSDSDGPGIQALPAGRQYQGNKPAKAPIDHSVVALGTVAALNVVSSPTFTVAFTLVASPSAPIPGGAPATSALTEGNGGGGQQQPSLPHLPYASFVASSSLLPPDALEVTLFGDWAQQLCGDSLHSPVLKTGCTLALSFKQGKWDAKPHSSVQTTQYRTSSQWRLLFTRGCELWVGCEEDPVHTQKATWTHSNTFAAAQGRTTAVSASTSSESIGSAGSDSQPSISMDRPSGTGPSNAPESAQRAWTASGLPLHSEDTARETPEELYERKKRENIELDRRLQELEVEREAERMVQTAMLSAQSAATPPAAAGSLQSAGQTDGMNSAPAQPHHQLVEPANPYQGGRPFARYDSCGELRMRKGDTTTVNVFGVVDAVEGIVESE